MRCAVLPVLLVASAMLCSRRWTVVAAHRGSIGGRSYRAHAQCPSESQWKRIHSLLAETQSEFRDTLLPPLLRPRVPGTEGHAQVRSFLLDFFRTRVHGWRTQVQRFQAETPIGRTEFHNVIATFQPPEPACDDNAKHLVLAAHYDSKREPAGFVGATDSAVPCAMLLHLALLLDRWWNIRNAQSAPSLTLRFLFFDGEEAFREWSRTDSTYGSRYMAEHWANMSPVMPTVRFQVDRNPPSLLDSIHLLLVLDLLAVMNPPTQFHDYIPSTTTHYQRLANLETHFQKLQLLHSPSHVYFPLRGADGLDFYQALERTPEGGWTGGIEDDHLPFLQRNVPVLHLIPYPFPAVWHTEKDTVEAVDFARVHDIQLLLTAFVAEQLEIIL